MSYGQERKKILRKKAKSDLFWFAKNILEYDLQPFHKEWCTILQTKSRILLLAPRGSYKSTVASIAYPLWLLVNNNNFRILIRSGTDKLAKSFLREIKGHIEHNVRFQYLFGNWKKKSTHWKEMSIIVPRSKRMKEVSIAVAGIGSNVVSQHYDVIIDDDIVTRKNVETAEMREKVRRAWQEDYGLLLTHGQNVVIGTRWHPEDLYGDILQNPQFDRILFKAHREDGSLLFPKVLSEEFLESQRTVMGTALYRAQYENDPSAFKQGATMFKREWFEIVKEYPHNGRKVRYWDLAGTKSRKSDFTVGVLMAEKDGIYYIVDVKKYRLSPKESEDLIRQTAVTDGIETAIYIEQEPGSSGIYTIDHFQRFVLPGFAFYPDKKDVSKIVRAQPFSAMAEAGNIKLVKADWNKMFLDEIEIFPKGEHDDQVDAASGAFHYLSESAAEAYVI